MKRFYLVDNLKINKVKKEHFKAFQEHFEYVWRAEGFFQTI